MEEGCQGEAKRKGQRGRGGREGKAERETLSNRVADIEKKDKGTDRCQGNRTEKRKVEDSNREAYRGRGSHWNGGVCEDAKNTEPERGEKIVALFREYHLLRLHMHA